MKYVIYGIVLSFLACSEPLKTAPSTGNNTDSSREEGVEAAYHTIAGALERNKPHEVNAYIHAETGLYIIETPGAVPRITRVTDISGYKSISSQQTLLPVQKDSFTLPLKKEALPEIACDSPYFYSKRGAFLQSINPLKDAPIWEYDDLLQEGEKKQLAKVAGTVRKTVHNTYNYKYYFSFIEGKWYLTFLDIRVPCSA